MLNFVIECEDDDNLMAFLLPPALKDNVEKEVYLKMFDRQFRMITGKSIFEHYVDTCCTSKGNVENFDKFLIIFALLEEFGTIKNIEQDVPIEKLLETADIDFKSQSKVRLEIVDGLIANIIAYWSVEDPSYQKYKKRFLIDNHLRPLYRMLFEVIEESDESKFIDNFFKNLTKLQDCLQLCYKDQSIEYKTTECLWAIMRSAILNDRRKIIDHILKHNNFSTIYLKFPPNIRTSDTASYFALRMLECGYEMGRDDNGDIPDSWITPEILKTFLDSRIKYHGKDSVELDSSFLLQNYTKQVQIRSSKDVAANPKLVFGEDASALEHIIKSPSLRKFITHPVVATYIDLKMKKFKWIYWWNFFLYVVLFIVPLALLSQPWYHPSIAFISVAFLTIRELLQCIWSGKDFFKKNTNKFEVFFTLLTLLFVLTTQWKESLSVNRSLLGFFNVLMILATTFDLLSSLRFAPPLFQFLIMLKTIVQTSTKYFLMNFIILVPFTFSFCILFASDAEYPTDPPDDAPNFLFFDTAFMEIVMMLSGEFPLEPYKLNYYQKVFFLVFVLTTFMLFNQYLAIIIGDVGKRRKDARYLMLMQNAENIIETTEYCFGYFNDRYEKKK